MKLLLFSDLHCDAAAALRLVELSQEVDVVVGAGDFANQRRGLNVCLDVLRGIERPLVFVAGNNESTEELLEACTKWPPVRLTAYWSPIHHQKVGLMFPARARVSAVPPCVTRS